MAKYFRRFLKFSAQPEVVRGYLVTTLMVFLLISLGYPLGWRLGAAAFFGSMALMTAAHQFGTEPPPQDPSTDIDTAEQEHARRAYLG